MMKGALPIFVAVLVVATLTAIPGNALSCGEVQSSLMPCLAYLSGGAEPTGSCCSGVKRLEGSAVSKVDRQTACNCMKSAAGSYKVDMKRASSLPGKCGVTVRYAITPNIDCSKIS